MWNARGVCRAVIFLVLAIAVAGCSRPLRPSWTLTRCMGRLRSIAMLALQYVDDHAGWLPVAEGENPAAHESLQLLADEFVDEYDSKIFVCPVTDDTPAVRGADGKVRLAAGNVSYAWRAKPLSLRGGGKVIIACDKVMHRHQGGLAGINVLYGEGAVKFFKAEELGEGGLDGFLTRHDLTR